VEAGEDPWVPGLREAVRDVEDVGAKRGNNNDQEPTKTKARKGPGMQFFN
jgi:hypothetical protein